MGVEGVPCPFKVRALGSHVAVRDSPYPVAHSPCLAGVDGRDRARSLREQEPARARRAFAMGRLGSFTGRVRMELALLGIRVLLVLRLALVHVASTPRAAADGEERVHLGLYNGRSLGSNGRRTGATLRLA